MKMEQTECSETSAYKIKTPGNYPKESIQQYESQCSFLTRKDERDHIGTWSHKRPAVWASALISKNKYTGDILPTSPAPAVITCYRPLEKFLI